MAEFQLAAPPISTLAKTKSCHTSGK